MTTRIQDIIEPTIFAAYIIEQTRKLSELIRSGIIRQDARLNELVSRGGRTINMPIWARISGESEVLSDQNPLTVQKISAKEDIATMHFRGNAWGSNQLAGAIAGDSPMQAIGAQVAEYWVEQEQKILISTLKGVFSSSTMSEHVLDASSDKISAEAVLDAKQKLGDAAGQLVAIFMHSATYTELQKQNLIVYIPNARGEVVIPTYLGYRVVVDDGMPKNGNVYDTYLFANGVIGRGDGIPVDLRPVQTDEDILQGDDILTNRRAFVLHPLGVRWIGTASGTSPTNAELEVGTNWERVYDDKNIGMVLLRHTL